MQVNPGESERCRWRQAGLSGAVRLGHWNPAAGAAAGLDRGSDCKAVLDAAREGDPLALAVAREAGRWLGLALSYVAAVTDPEIILLGGGVARAGEVLLKPVREQYRASVFHGAAETEFALAALGNDAGMYGAAKLALEP